MARVSNPRDLAKDAVKRAVKNALALGGGVLGRSADRSLILTYHSAGSRDHAMNVVPEQFRIQMEWLASSCKLISVDDAIVCAPGVAVTFDDGYRDTLTHAWPVLAEFHVPATAFIVPGRVGGRLDHDSGLTGSELMTWTEIRELAALGMDMGGHSMTHPRLADLDEAKQRQEIRDCKTVLEDRLGQKVSGFAYPFGSAWDFDDTSRQLVQESGFNYALSNRYGVNSTPIDKWDARRIWIDRSDTLASFTAKVDGRLDMLSLLDTGLGMGIRRSLNRVLRIR